MGIIFSQNTISITGKVSARTANASYPVTNVAIWDSLVQHFRADDALANDWLLKIDFTAATPVAALFINHCNFDSITIQGNATDVWTSPSFTSTVSISKDRYVGRYKAFIALTAFNYRYLRLFIPTGETPTGGEGYWFVSSVIPVSATTEFSLSMDYPYARGAGKPFKDNEFPSGKKERILTGSHKKWMGRISWGTRPSNSESDMLTLHEMDIEDPLIYFENMGDTSRAYYCLRDNAYENTLAGYNRQQPKDMGFSEVI
ncbi:MAG: hypothetical protein ABIK68_05280 [bacterium]